MKTINIKLGIKEILGIVIIIIMLSFSFSNLTYDARFRFGNVILIDTLTGNLKLDNTKDIYVNTAYLNSYLRIFDGNDIDHPYWMRINYALQKLTFLDSVNTVYNFAFDGEQSIDLDSCGISILDTGGIYCKYTDVFTSSGDSSGMTQEGVIKVEISGVDRYILLYK